MGHWGVATAGAHVGYRNYAGLQTMVFAAQAEAHVTPEVTLVAIGAAEHATYAGDLFRAAIGLRVFPLPRLLVEGGVGFNRIGDSETDDISDPYFGVEWQLPFRATDWQLSVFGEVQVSTVKLLGLRSAWGMGATQQDQVRQMGCRRLR